MGKFKRVVINVPKTLGRLTFLRQDIKDEYVNGVKTGKFVYNIYLLSEEEQGEFLIAKFHKALDIPFGTEVEIVGDAILNSTVSGSGDFRSVAHTIEVEDIKVKGAVNQSKETPNK